MFPPRKLCSIDPMHHYSTKAPIAFSVSVLPSVLLQGDVGKLLAPTDYDGEHHRTHARFVYIHFVYTRPTLDVSLILCVTAACVLLPTYICCFFLRIVLVLSYDTSDMLFICMVVHVPVV